MDARVSDSEPDADEMNRLLLRLMKGVNGQVFRAFGNKVFDGPFSGMIIPAQAPWDDGNSSSKLFGFYEFELREAIDHAIWRNPKIVVNVGCAEGYYAIGFARLGAKVIGLDTSVESRMVCEDFAEQNGVKVTLIDGARAPEELRFPEETGNRLYIIDCEGEEVTLVDLEACPEMRSADIIVECHDFMRFGASRMLAERLSQTHKVELIRTKLPDFDAPLLRKQPSVMAVLALMEKRPMPCYWLACWANSRGEQNG